MSQRVRHALPWPGPMPYDEDRWDVFFGRTFEVDAAERRLANSRLLVITGSSGTGKTSLLRAGLVPRLRLRRYRHAVSFPWPVLVLRDWGAGQRIDLTSLLIAELKASVDRLEVWPDKGDRVASDVRALRKDIQSAPRGSGFLGLIEGIARNPYLEGVILVFDQLEELLRLGEETAGQVCSLLAELHESDLDLKLVLALRREHLSDLRSLERLVGGVLGQTLFLERMTANEARDAVQLGAESKGIFLEAGAVDYAFGQLSSATRDGGEYKQDDASTSEVGIDLLALQAILHLLGLEKLRGLTHNEAFQITRSDFASCVEEARTLRVSLGEWALRSWIDLAFEPGREDAPEAEEAELEIGDFLPLARRLAVRMPPHLSSSGFKIALEESDLFTKAVGADVLSLGLRDPSMRNKIQIRFFADSALSQTVASKVDQAGETLGAVSHGTPLGNLRGVLDVDALGLPAEDDNAAEFLAGTPLKEGWTRRQAAVELYRAFAYALELLRTSNIVKPVFGWLPRGGIERRWELVHDGLGGPFIHWAEDQRDTWADAAAALVASKGISPIIVRSGDPVGRSEFLRWEGCLVCPIQTKLMGIEPARQELEEKLGNQCALQETDVSPKGEVVLTGVTFSECQWRGSVFEGIVFRGCRFLRCNLDGAVFRSCRFEAGDQDPVIFDECHPHSLAIIGDQTIVGHVIFNRCQVSQLTLKDAAIAGRVEFVGCDVTLSAFIGLRKLGEEGMVRFNSDCRVSFCSGDESSFALISIEGGRDETVRPFVQEKTDS